jgi:hypothetical protein
LEQAGEQYQPISFLVLLYVVPQNQQDADIIFDLALYLQVLEQYFNGQLPFGCFMAF